MALKSLLSQSRQIKSSKAFADVDLGAANADRKTLAEGQSYLEEDLNILRSMIKDITGETEWSDIPQVTLAEAAATSKKLILQPIQTELLAVNGTSFVTTLDTTFTNNTATTDIGYIVDDSATPSVSSKARITLREKNSNQVLVNSAENEIFGIGTNDGSGKIKVNFYTDVNGVATPATVAADLELILPYRIELGNLDENALLTNAGFAGAVGAFELGDRVYVDVDNNGTPVFGFVEDEDLTAALNKVAAVSGADKLLGDNVSTVSGITSKTYTTTFGTDGASYLVDNDTLISAIMKLDAEAKILEAAVSNASGDEVSEILTADIAEGTPYTIPNSKTYLNSDKDAVTVFVNGQKLASDLVIGDGSVGNGDYTPFSTTVIKFNLPLEATDLVTCVITKAQ